MIPMHSYRQDLGCCNDYQLNFTDYRQGYMKHALQQKSDIQIIWTLAMPL